MQVLVNVRNSVVSKLDVDVEVVECSGEAFPKLYIIIRVDRSMRTSVPIPSERALHPRQYRQKVTHRHKLRRPAPPFTLGPIQ